MTEWGDVAYQYKVIKPAWSENCHCGSAMKFGVCCRGRLPGFEIGKRYTTARKARSWEVALLATRADITQYTIWHKTNVEPFLHQLRETRMLTIDINALGSYVERVQWLYMNTGREEAWLDTLDRLSNNIKQRPWQRKIAYFRALFFLRPGMLASDARRELKKAGPITTEETDIELLQIFIDLEFADLAFSDRLKYLDRVVEVSDDLSDQIQYRCLKAVQLFLIRDNDSAERLFAEAVAEGRIEEYHPLKRYEKQLFARAVQYLGMIRNDKALLEESISEFRELMLDDNWTPLGMAALHSEVGQSYKFLEDWAAAEGCHRTALELHDNALDRIHLAEALLYQRKVPEVCVEIDLLDAEALTGPALEDFALAYAVIAIWSGDRPRLERALIFLDAYNPTEPYFRERQLKLLRSVDRGISAGKIADEDKLESAPKGGFLNMLSQFVTIQQNGAGIGINFNAIMDEIAKQSGTEPSIPRKP